LHITITIGARENYYTEFHFWFCFLQNYIIPMTFKTLKIRP